MEKAMELPAHVPSDLAIEFDIFAPPGVEQDFHAAWMALQSQAPAYADIVWSTSNGGHWIPIRGSAIHAFFSDHENFSSRFATLPRERALLYTAKPQTLDPPRHKHFRGLLSPVFAPKRVQALENRIRAMAIELIDGIAAKGGCEFNAEYCAQLPIQVFMSLVDLPLIDATMLKNWTDQLARPDELSLEDIYANYHGYLAPYMAARKANPGDDLLSLLVNGSVEGRPVTDDEAMDLCTQVLFGGLDTVAALIGFVVHFLARSADHQRQLRESPSLIAHAIPEFVRRFPIATPARMVARDYEHNGVLMREGDIVAMGTMVHGLDPKEFPLPLEVDFDRQLAPVSTFGNGIHQCPGHFLARAELRITLEEWLSRIPEFRIADPAAVTMRGGQVGLITHLPLTWS